MLQILSGEKVSNLLGFLGAAVLLAFAVEIVSPQGQVGDAGAACPTEMSRPSVARGAARRFTDSSPLQAGVSRSLASVACR